MPWARELADAVESTGSLLLRYLEGFDDARAYAAAPNLPNHAAWTLGHLALTMHRAAERIGGAPQALPWDPEPYAFGSTPGHPGPPLAEMVERYRKSMTLLAEAARRAGEDGLSKTVEWGRTTMSARDLLMRMVFHNGTHCGQVVDLRRALGMPRVIR